MAGRRAVRFVAGDRSPRMADYSVASGIFNVRLGELDDGWQSFVRATLHQLALTSSRGFAVNFVDPPLCGGWVAPGLYTTSPEPWVEDRRDHIGADVAVITGYGMREFSLLARRPGAG